MNANESAAEASFSESPASGPSLTASFSQSQESEENDEPNAAAAMPPRLERADAILADSLADFAAQLLTKQ